MSGGMIRESSISIYWTDDQWHNTDYDVKSKEDGFSKIDARVQFSKDDWYVAILGKNLTDEYTSSWNQQTAYTLGTGQFSILYFCGEQLRPRWQRSWSTTATRSGSS